MSTAMIQISCVNAPYKGDNMSLLSLQLGSAALKWPLVVIADLNYVKQLYHTCICVFENTF